ncbi:ArnT family glycosyltransferase [Anaeroselena agilis]|uniref:Glycosyltransferase family 39 protein n=1 Tax=Anaeroselena agilis TaxID=3063788 RepID=A0ABU3NY92_9FIRM|nr:glycosyltransferase family 39 protein [Selenomonadales bacterium 4137-cl]
MTDRISFGTILIILIAAFVMFYNLGGIPLLDPDEPVYAETAKEMLSHNDFVSPRIYGEYWYDKPPMYYWLVAASFKLFGVSEFAARLPSAVLAILCALYVYSASSRMFGNRAGLAGALILVTSIEYFYLGKAAVTDITLNLFLTVALLAFLEKRYYLFYICAGLATVTKGPVGFLFPGAIIFIYMLLTRSFHLLREMKIPAGIVLFALAGLPWYIAMYAIHGNAFVDTFLGFHNITRFTSPEHPEGVLWYYFIPVFIIGFMPWTAIVIQSVWAALTDSQPQHGRPLLFLIIWAAFIFLFFTASRTKLVSYILPMYPPLAMVAGWYIDRLAARRRNARPFAWPLLFTVLGGLFAAGAVYGARQAMPALLPGAYLTAAVFVVMIIGTWFFVARRETERAFWLQIAGMAVFVVILMSLLFPPAAPAFHTRDLAKAFTAHYDGKSPVYVVKFLRPGFSFYAGVYGTELTPDHWKTPGKAYFVVRPADWEWLPEADKRKLKVLATADEKLLIVKQ